MKLKEFFPEIILKEWLLSASAVGVTAISLYSRHLPRFSPKELQVVLILAALFVSVKGLEQSGWIRQISLRFEQGKHVPLKLVLATFFFSMIVTNDVALIVFVPLTLSINMNKKGNLVILEALAANAGSALTPFGNPQNLYIYWFYNVPIESFVSAIAPFCFLFLVLLIFAAFFMKSSAIPSPARVLSTDEKNRAIVYLFLLFILILTVLHILPIIAGCAVFIYAVLFDRKSLKIDFSLLLTFIFFFGITDNLQYMLPASIQHSSHIFLLSSITSQFISNVPATLLIAQYTKNWHALLWGVNAGGFGSLLGSFANLIAYKLYLSYESTEKGLSFTVRFLLVGYLFFFSAFAFYFVLYG